MLNCVLLVPMRSSRISKSCITQTSNSDSSWLNNRTDIIIVMSRLLYALSLWSGYLSIELIGQINSLLKQAYKYGFSSTLHTVENMAILHSVQYLSKQIFSSPLRNIPNTFRQLKNTIESETKSLEHYITLHYIKFRVKNAETRQSLCRHF